MVDFVNIDCETIISVDKNHHSIAQLEKYVVTKAVLYKNVASEMIIKENVGLSILCLNHAIELDAEDWTLFFKRGVLLSQLGHFESALIDLKTCLEKMNLFKLKEGSANGVMVKERSVMDHLGSIYNQMGIIAFQKDRHDIALVYFGDALGCNDQTATVYRNRADCYIQIKYYEAAKSDLQIVIEIQPDDQESVIKLANIEGKLGSMQFSQGRYQTSVVCYSVAIELDPSVEVFEATLLTIELLL
jgi:tetratricopeptide (TPR) repeat protein